MSTDKFLLQLMGQSYDMSILYSKHKISICFSQHTVGFTKILFWIKVFLLTPYFVRANEQYEIENNQTGKFYNQWF